MDRQPNSFCSFSSSLLNRSWTHDVFLSFRGVDTRYHFTGNLYKALSDKKIRTFIDDTKLKGGDEITSSLVKAIKESCIAIVVFSKDYASSSFCLDELATIMEFVKGEGRLVYPIFYEVDPSVVRHQKESYGEAMAKHKERFKDDMDKVHKWSEALRQAANLSGKHVKGDDYEHVYIKNITEEILNKIPQAPLFVTEYPVGLEPRVQEVCHLLNIESHGEVIMVGIHGIGGIGKTTLAKAVYNSIALQFEGCCFLEKVSEKMKKHGLEHLQEMVISKLLGIKDIKVDSVSEGIQVLQMLRQKKVLLILDDVDDREQLRAIVGADDWFGSGSRVIITTRDMNLLNIPGIKRNYKVHGLEEEEAYQLLIWKAFGCENIDSCFKDISKRAVTYACGLPLVLEVIGSNLYNKSIQEWECTLDRYKQIPDENIQKRLKISFDYLGNFQKNLFLDIACYSGYAWDFGVYGFINRLRACYDVSLDYDIKKLVQKSLLETYHGLVHDLIRDMAREIVREESPNYPGERSRLWCSKEIVQVLENNSGSGKIEMIILDAPKDEKVSVQWDGNAFRKMKNLRILIIRNACFSQGPIYLPNSLRVLEWHNLPSNLLPCLFHPNNGKLMDLKVLKLDGSNILKISDVSGAPNLESLSLRCCKNLIEVHESVGFLNKLSYLDLSGCSKLKTIPALMLPHLEGLGISECSSLEKFPELLCYMENFTSLSIMNTSIEELSSSFTKLRNLNELSIYNEHEMLRISSSIFSMLPYLCEVEVCGANWLHFLEQHEEEGQGSSLVSSNTRHVAFTDCNMLDESVAMVIALFRNVNSLDLSGSSFTFLPESIKELCSLAFLYLNYCKKLKEIRGIPPNIEVLHAIQCMSLSHSSRSMLLDKELHSTRGKKFLLPGTSFPKWLEYKAHNPHSISLWFRNKLPPLSLCIPGPIYFYILINGISVHMHNEIGQEDWYEDEHYIVINDIEESSLNYYLGQYPTKLSNGWSHAEFRFQYGEFDHGPNKIGIHIHTNENNMEDIRFTDPLQQSSSSTSLQGTADLSKFKGKDIIIYDHSREGSWHYDLCRLRLGSDSDSDSDSVIIHNDEGLWHYDLFQLRLGLDLDSHSVIIHNDEVSSDDEDVSFRGCDMFDESLTVVLALFRFRNVVSLDLSENSFTFLPESIKEFCSLRQLCMGNCKKLEEIRGIPPNVQNFCLANCISLSPSSRSKLLDKELHSTGEKIYCLPGNSYPKWLEHRIESKAIHLWFRNKIPPLSLCLPGCNSLYAFINGKRSDLIKYWSSTKLISLEDELVSWDDETIRDQEGCSNSSRKRKKSTFKWDLNNEAKSGLDSDSDHAIESSENDDDATADGDEAVSTVKDNEATISDVAEFIIPSPSPAARDKGKRPAMLQYTGKRTRAANKGISISEPTVVPILIDDEESSDVDEELARKFKQSRIEEEQRVEKEIQKAQGIGSSKSCVEKVAESGYAPILPVPISNIIFTPVSFLQTLLPNHIITPKPKTLTLIYTQPLLLANYPHNNDSATEVVMSETMILDSSTSSDEASQTGSPVFYVSDPTTSLLNQILDNQRIMFQRLDSLEQQQRAQFALLQELRDLFN